MKKIKVHVATGGIGSERTRVVEFDDDATEEEIQEIVGEVANEMVDVWHEEVE